MKGVLVNGPGFNDYKQHRQVCMAQHPRLCLALAAYERSKVHILVHDSYNIDDFDWQYRLLVDTACHRFVSIHLDDPADGI
jgi:hypothetical protein